MFVIYDCGCKGLIVKQPHGSSEATTHILVKGCDDPDDEFCFMERNDRLSKKAYEPVQHMTAILGHVRSINRLIADGYSMRQVKSLIEHCSLDPD